jgi:hypothetical protein
MEQAVIERADFRFVLLTEFALTFSHHDDSPSVQYTLRKLFKTRLSQEAAFLPPVIH